MNNSNEANIVRKKGNFKYFLFLIILIVILLSKAIFFEFYRVNSVSMMDTLLPGDFVLVNKLSYGANTPNKITIPLLNFIFDLPSFKLCAFSDIKPDDIIVIRKKLPDRPEKYIKRCVAVAGQTIEIKLGKLYIDGLLQDAPSLTPDQIRKAIKDDIPLMEVPDGFIFVLGDNRNLSYDSRSFGFVDVDDVIGKEMFIYSSIDSNGDFRWGRFFMGVE